MNLDDLFNDPERAMNDVIATARASLPRPAAELLTADELHAVNVELDLAVNPVPLARARVVAGRSYTPARSAEFCETFRWLLREQGIRAPIREDLALDLRFWRHHRGNNRGDLDNLVKAVLDAGNGFLWEDDRQVVSLAARFADAGPNVDGRIVIRITAPIDLAALRLAGQLGRRL